MLLDQFYQSAFESESYSKFVTLCVLILVIEIHTLLMVSKIYFAIPPLLFTLPLWSIFHFVKKILGDFGLL